MGNRSVRASQRERALELRGSPLSVTSNINRASYPMEPELKKFASDKSQTTNAQDETVPFEEEFDTDYKVLTPTDVVAIMGSTINRVTELTELKETTARVLLNHVKWDRDAFNDRYFGDLPKFFADAGAAMPRNFRADSVMGFSASCSGPAEKCSLATITPSLSIAPLTDVTDCPICYTSLDEEGASPFVSNGCGHVFCTQCWVDYLTGKIVHEGMASFIQCPGFDCEILVDDDLVLKLIQDPKVRTRYEKRIIEEFVSCHRLMKFCPAPECAYVLQTNLLAHGAVRCHCGLVFCFSCGGDVHDPIDCDIQKIWNAKVAKDNETGNWFLNNTKECPKCQTVIEKNGGCNHMTCRMPSCRYEFCWICLGPWAPHGNTWYRCNIFQSAEARDARDAQSNRRYEMERFLFYSNRFKNHMSSLKFEDNLTTKVESTMMILQENGVLSLSDFVYIRRGVTNLIKCRRTLAFTYVFAYFLKKNNECHIFEDNQKDLELAVENLSELLENKFSAETKEREIKTTIINKSDYCENRRKILMKHVREGEELNTWEFETEILPNLTPDELKTGILQGVSV